MANYLERVAAAGARTIPPARPPMTGPVLMPGVVRAARIPILSHPEDGAPLEVEPALSYPRTETVEPAISVKPAEMPVVQEASAPAIPPPIRREAPSTQPAPPQPPKREEPPSAARPALPPSTAWPMRVELPGTQRAPIVRMPRAIRPSETAAPLPVTPPKAPVAAPPQHIVETRTEYLEVPAAAAKPPRIEPPRIPPSPIERAVATPPPVIAQVQAPAAPATPDIRTGHARPRSRIHIGRVEVQVQNPPSAPPRPPAPAARPFALDALEARFLGRFRLAL